MVRRWQTRVKQILILSICLCFGFSIGLAIRQFLLDNDDPIKSVQQAQLRQNTDYQADNLVKHPRNILPVLEHRRLKNKIDQVSKTLGSLKNFTHTIKPVNSLLKSEDRTRSKEQNPRLPPNYNVHVFYYPWYGNPSTDRKYLHWDHQYIPHWKKKEAKKWRTDKHKPPDDVGANFYPSLGPYSSNDPDIVDKHMEMMASARIGVVVVSWYPPGTGDQDGNHPDSLMPLILDKADKYSLKVALHIEPYENRDEVNMKDNLRYIVSRYGNHSAFYRYERSDGKRLPMYYIYDSYLLSPGHWKRLLHPTGGSSVRGTTLDGIFIGLLVEQKHQFEIQASGFDGFYTYFASNGFTFGSKWNNWKKISIFAKSNKLLFIPSVGPGYVDTEVRPWNAANTKSRDHGKYYSNSFQSALTVHSPLISITSFNEWHEGTQIEPAIPKVAAGRTYEDYGHEGPGCYLNLTRYWVDKYSSDAV